MLLYCPPAPGEFDNLPSMSTDITIVGLPITLESTTERFLDFVKQDRVILITAADYTDVKQTNDYACCPAGFDVLFNLGYDFNNIGNRSVISLDAWNSKNRNIGAIVAEVLKENSRLKQQYPDYAVAYLTTGSPYLADGVSSIILGEVEHVTVINTKSSVMLAFDLIGSRDLLINLVDNSNPVLRSQATNFIVCAGPLYSSQLNLQNQLTDADTIYGLQVGQGITTYTKMEFEQLLNTLPESMNSTLFAVVKK